MWFCGKINVKITWSTKTMYLYALSHSLLFWVEVETKNLYGQNHCLYFTLKVEKCFTKSFPFLCRFFFLKAQKHRSVRGTKMRPPQRRIDLKLPEFLVFCLLCAMKVHVCMQRKISQLQIGVQLLVFCAEHAH